MREPREERKFNYAVGHYWTGQNGSVGVYNYFGQVHYGTMAEAKNLLKYVNSQDKKEPKVDRKDWRIFQLSEVYS